jgi:hypothetical protein
LLPVRASSKMSSRRESAVNSTYFYKKINRIKNLRYFLLSTFRQDL